MGQGRKRIDPLNNKAQFGIYNIIRLHILVFPCSNQLSINVICVRKEKRGKEKGSKRKLSYIGWSPHVDVKMGFNGFSSESPTRTLMALTKLVKLRKILINVEGIWVRVMRAKYFHAQDFFFVQQ